MGRLLALALVMVLPVVAGEAPPPGCAWLCGNWSLDAGQGDNASRLIDAALQDYDEPRPGRDQPTRAQLRQELLALLAPPASLTLAEQGDDILIRVTGQPERRIVVGETRNRTDAAGTAEVRASWRSDDSLAITETYDRRRSQSENFALQRDGTLVITREVERPGVKRLRVRSVYRRS